MELEEELLELTRALRAHAEWQLACGAHGLPRGSSTSVVALEPEVRRGPVERARGPRGDGGRGASEPGRIDGRHPERFEDARVDGTRAAHARGGEAPAEPAPSAPRRPSGGPAPDAARRLEVLAEQVRGCTACGLHAGRKQAVFARGTGSSRLCFVGEGPGADEDAQGFPFVGKAGQLLDRMIAAMGFERDEVYVCNVVKCRPPNNRKPEAHEIAACSPYLHQQIELLDPEVIVALGATAVEGLLGVTGGITRMRGRMKLYKGRIAVMPTFHPAYLLRNPAAKADVWKDLQAVVRQMGRQLPSKR